MPQAFSGPVSPAPQTARCFLTLLITAASLFITICSAWAEAPKTEIGLGGSYDQLTNDFGSWSSIDLEGVHAFSRHKKIVGGLRRTTRFSQSDTEFAIGSYYPLTSSLVGKIILRAASPGIVLAQQSLFLGAQQDLGEGWVIHGAYQKRQFGTASVDQFIVRGEYYFSKFRADFTFTQARLDTGDTALGQGASLSRYYGNRSNINVKLASGEEIEKITDDRVARFEVFSAAFWARHWFSDTWGLTYGMRYREQGSLYELAGINVGVLRGF